MGAALDYKVYKTDDKPAIKTQWDADVEHSQYMDGVSYSGSIGMLTDSLNFVSVPPFNSLNEATVYIEDNHSKFDNPMAVPFNLKSAKEVPAYVKKAEKKYNDTERDIRRIEDKLKREFFEAKSKFVGCKKCKSKISRTFLNSTFCPICNQTLLSDTNTRRIEKGKQKVKTALSAMHEAKEKARQQNCTGKVGYVVGGLCSS